MRKAVWMLVCSVGAATPGLVLAQGAAVPAPSADAIKSVWEFQRKGQGGGVVLADSKLCLELQKDGPDKNECATMVPAEGVKAGTTVNLWQAYLIPNGDTIEDLTVQVKQGDTVRETKDIKPIKGEGWRTRTWTGVTIKKAGSWTLSVMRGDKVLASHTIKAE